MRFTKLVPVRQIHVYALLKKYEQNVALNHFIACFSYNVFCMKIQSILARWLYIPQAIQLTNAPYTLEPSQLESFIANPAFVTLETSVLIRRLSPLSLYIEVVQTIRQSGCLFKRGLEHHVLVDGPRQCMTVTAYGS